MSSTGPRTRPAAAAVRAARSAPALPLRSVAAAAGVTVDVAARQLRGLRLRATCSELVFEAVASVRDPFKRLDDYRTMMAVYAHPASPRGLLRCLSADRVAGLEKGVPASSTARWSAQRRAGAPLNVAAPRVAVVAAARSFLLPARRGAAAHLSCPPLVLTRIAIHERSEMSVTAEATRNPNCAPAVLAALSRDEDVDVRARIAEHPSCPAVALTTIAETDPNMALRARALRPTDPAVVVGSAAAHPDPLMRIVAAKHRDISPELLTTLAEDPTPRTRQTVAAHPSCPTSVLQRLASDPDVYVRAVAVANPNISYRLVANAAHDHAPQTRAAAAARGDCPPDVLQRLAGDDSVNVRAASAANTACDVDAVNFDDPATSVQAALAARGDCPPDVLDRLAGGTSVEASAAAVANPAISSRRLADAIRDGAAPVVAAALGTLRRRALAQP